MLYAAATGALAQEKGAPTNAGFTLRVSTMDILMINKALMLLPDDHAKETLDSIRSQITSQVK